MKAFIISNNRKRFNIVGRRWFRQLQFLHRIDKVGKVQGYNLNINSINLGNIKNLEQLINLIKEECPKVVSPELGLCTKLQARSQARCASRIHKTRPVPVCVEKLVD